ncbi:hypothetical protein niasHT_008550 [Heterodera trifolii]|uniref:Effector protein n=1 Tax=Heterodera trifolii TaxID=157864 RepID=A0ABD2MAG7_9BILA
MNLLFKFFIIFVILHCECETLGSCAPGGGININFLSKLRKKPIASSTETSADNRPTISAAEFDQRLKKIEQMLDPLLKFENADHALAQLEKRIESLVKRVEAVETKITAWNVTFEIKEKQMIEQQRKQMHDEGLSVAVSSSQGRQSTAAAAADHHPHKLVLNKNIVPRTATTTVVEQQHGNGKMPIYGMASAQMGRRNTVAHLGQRHPPQQRDAFKMPSQHLPTAEKNDQRLESQRSGPSNLEEHTEDMDTLWIVSSDEDKH